MQSRLYKSAHGGWACETIEPMEGGKNLRITTMKRYSGRLCTTARAEKIEPSGMSTFQPFKDFSRTLIETDTRATARAVEAQHRAALMNINSVIALAQAQENAQ